jgi:hypothetical protein
VTLAWALIVSRWLWIFRAVSRWGERARLAVALVVALVGLDVTRTIPK